MVTTDLFVKILVCAGGIAMASYGTYLVVRGVQKANEKNAEENTSATIEAEQPSPEITTQTVKQPTTSETKTPKTGQ